MSKEDAIQMEGEVIQALPNTTFRVKLRNRLMNRTTGTVSQMETRAPSSAAHHSSASDPKVVKT